MGQPWSTTGSPWADQTTATWRQQTPNRAKTQPQTQIQIQTQRSKNQKPKFENQLAQSQKPRRQASFFSVGNSNTSRMLGLLVSSIIRRSMPMPQPPVGGMQTSRARMKSAS